MLLAAGDIADCNSTGDEATAAILDANPGGTVATLGDNAYENGTATEFANCYEPTWGRHKASTRPSPGNHDYHTSDAAGYFGYFGAAAGPAGRGYYSYDLGSWHVISLNSERDTGASGEQVAWLKADLAATQASCVLAYWHQPRWSAGTHGDTTSVNPFWDALYAAGADVVLAGHDHNYQRVKPLDATGAVDSLRGIRSFVVGTGGRGPYAVPSDPRLDASQTGTHGVLKLTLRTGAYDWQFLPVAGKTYTDSGSGACHDGSAPTSPPPPPPPPPPPSDADPAANCIGEPANHPVVSYPEPRVFLEAQGWWDDRDDDGQVARFGDSEHLHIGMCFPLQQTVSGPMRLDIRAVGHNLPAGSLIRNTRFHDAPGQLYEDIRYERTIAAGEMDVAVWKTLNWDSSEAPDGLRETRFLTFVERPDGAEIHASTGWCVNFQNGKTDSNYDSCNRRLTEGRGWYDCIEYKSSRTDEWTYPYGGIPAGQAYTLNVSGQDGATFGDGGDDVVTDHWLRLDPNFHTSDLGTPIFEHAGAHRNEAVTIPGSLLTPGLHFLFLMTERDGQCAKPGTGTVFPGQIFPQDGILSGGLRIPIKVN